MKQQGTLAIAALILVAMPALYRKHDDLPEECTRANFTNTGRPVMFSPRDGLSMGISTPRATLEVSDPAVIYVWVNNQTDNEKTLMSCQMWWDWGVTVYDDAWSAVRTLSEQEQESRPAGETMHVCGRNLALPIPPHSCSPLQDMGDVKIDLRKERDLRPGNYFVTEKGSTAPLRGLRISIMNKEIHP